MNQLTCFNLHSSGRESCKTLSKWGHLQFLGILSMWLVVRSMYSSKICVAVHTSGVVFAAEIRCCWSLNIIAISLEGSFATVFHLNFLLIVVVKLPGKWWLFRLHWSSLNLIICVLVIIVVSVCCTCIHTLFVLLRLASRSILWRVTRSLCARSVLCPVLFGLARSSNAIFLFSNVVWFIIAVSI